MTNSSRLKWVSGIRRSSSTFRTPRLYEEHVPGRFARDYTIVVTKDRSRTSVQQTMLVQAAKDRIYAIARRRHIPLCVDSCAEGLHLVRDRDYDGAIRWYGYAIDKDPGYAPLFVYRADAYIGKEDYERALSDCDQAIRLDVGYAYAFRIRGNAHYDKGDYDRAIADYDEAIRLDPDDAYAFNRRGNVYYGKADYRQALADYDRAIALNANNASFFFNRGETYEQLGRAQEALADIRKALALDPADERIKQTLRRLTQAGKK